MQDTKRNYDNARLWGSTRRAAFMDGKPVTLDGRPATVSGFMLKFAKVRSLDGKFSGEWSWPAAVRVVDNGGAFYL